MLPLPHLETPQGLLSHVENADVPFLLTQKSITFSQSESRLPLFSLSLGPCIWHIILSPWISLVIFFKISQNDAIASMTTIKYINMSTHMSIILTQSHNQIMSTMHIQLIFQLIIYRLFFFQISLNLLSMPTTQPQHMLEVQLNCHHYHSPFLLS